MFRIHARLAIPLALLGCLPAMPAAALLPRFIPSAPAIPTEKWRRPRGPARRRKVRDRDRRTTSFSRNHLDHQRDLHRPADRRWQRRARCGVEIYRVFPTTRMSGARVGRQLLDAATCPRGSIRPPTSRSSSATRRPAACDSRPVCWTPASPRTTRCSRAAFIRHRTRPPAATAQSRARKCEFDRELHPRFAPPRRPLFLRASGRGYGRRRQFLLAVGAEADRRPRDTIPARLHRPAKLDPR